MIINQPTTFVISNTFHPRLFFTFTANLLFKRLPIKYFDAFNLALVLLNDILRSWLEPVTPPSGI